jgi:alpha-N-arabinofuranosidase
MIKELVTAITIMLTVCSLYGAEYHVSSSGLDSNKGSKSKPFKTLSAAADIAQPGDAITVHEGTYRERVNPPRGGTSDDKRIVYQAAPGEKPVIKGSEIVTDWNKIQNDTWELALPNSFFGSHNPYKIKVHGDWFNPLRGTNRVYHTGSVYLNGHWLTEAASKEQVLKPAGKTPLWFAEVDDKHTTIHAQFIGVDPNKQTVEINVREAVFYPETPGMNYITVRGFTMEHAAPNWAPPTAEQVGLIGTHWSKGWIIEDNTIRYSTCTGITLGKYGDEMDNKAESAKGYVGTIKRALENGWSKQNIGHHVVRNNHISHCEQAGIVGSMGAIFSTITENTIYEINMRRIFGGAEMAGIKFHGAIDTVISHNHIYLCGGWGGGIWLDWMTQGTRVTGNLLHDNKQVDLFVEVNHGPFLIDNNLFLSGNSIRDWSQGAAYAHNLFAGGISSKEEKRETPYFEPHTVEEMKLSNIQHKDARYFNNLFLGKSSLPTGDIHLSLQAAGNANLTSVVKLEEKANGLWVKVPQLPKSQECDLVTTELLGKAKASDAPFENPDGTSYRLDTDYFGKKRNAENPAPGPFAIQGDKEIHLKAWPKK